MKKGRLPVPRAAAPPVDGLGLSPAAKLLWAWLALLAAGRAATALLPSTWAWSLDAQRFLPAWSGWGLWALLAASLVPALAQRGASAFEAAGQWMMRHPGLAAAVSGIAAAGLMLLLADRTQFVGDFLLRQATLREGLGTLAWYPQAMPLDLAIHHGGASQLMTAFTLDANQAGRFIGAVEVAVLAILAVRLARVLDLQGATALAASAILFWGGYLTLFTGYNKAFSEMCLLAAAVGVFGLDVVKDGRGLVGLGLAFSLGVVLHRSALGLLPATAAAWAIWLLEHRRREPRWPVVLAGLGLPLVVLASQVPRLAGIITRVDPVHFAPADVQARGVLAATFDPLRIADLLNLAVMLSPIALALPFLALRAPPGRRRESIFLTALVLPLVAIAPFIHPGQGYFRDWDDFAATGVALSVAAAWVTGEALRASSRRAAWLAVAVCLGVAAPAVQWLALQTGLDRGSKWAQAFAEDSPTRPKMERYTTWEFLGMRFTDARRLDDAAGAYANAAAAVASPHILNQWAMAEMNRNGYAQAQTIYGRIVEANPRDAFGWWGYAIASFQLGDSLEAYRATRRSFDLDSTNQAARQTLIEWERKDPP